MRDWIQNYIHLHNCLAQGAGSAGTYRAFFVSEDHFNMNSTTGQIYSLSSIPINPPLEGYVEV
jgi:hypothetical protein